MNAEAAYGRKDHACTLGYVDRALPTVTYEMRHDRWGYGIIENLQSFLSSCSLMSLSTCLDAKFIG